MNKTYAQILLIAAKKLEKIGISSSISDSKKILAGIMGISKEKLVLLDSEIIPQSIKVKFFQKINLRKQFQPVSQIIGYRSFWGRNFFINEKVLDPRPETEELIYHALKKDFSNVLDLGTGSGIIIITLLLENTLATGIGVDIDFKALKVAKKNSNVFAVEKRIDFVHSDWCEQIDEKFDLVISNPPYININERDQYDLNLAKWEPYHALFSKSGGLAAYVIIAKQLENVLKKSGLALFEIGHTQAQLVSQIFTNEGYKVEVFKDMSEKDRVIKVTFY
jgi:release factor glutamine methyltransferase